MAGPGGGGPPVVAWFRRDLRLADNPMLTAAAADGADVVALFVVDPALTVPAGAHRLGFLAGCLDELDRDTGGARSWSVTATPPRSSRPWPASWERGSCSPPTTPARTGAGGTARWPPGCRRPARR